MRYLLDNPRAAAILRYIYERTTRKAKVPTWYGYTNVTLVWGGVSSKEIADALGIPLRTVQYYLRKLVREGYVTKWERRYSRTKRVVRYGIAKWVVNMKLVI